MFKKQIPLNGFCNNTFMSFIKRYFCQMWHLPLIPSPGKKKQVEFWEFEASLVYKVSCRTTRATQRETLSQKNKRQKLTLKKKGGEGSAAQV